MANQGPQRAADEPYGEASFRTFAGHSFPLFVPAERRPSKAACFLNRTISVQATPFMPVFYRSGKLHAFSPCIYQASWSDAAFGAASQSWKDICQSFSGISRSNGCSGGCVSALGRPLASTGRRGVALAVQAVQDRRCTMRLA